ncbi:MULTISPECIES: GspE/PulE family protein [Methylobacillus]|uniref:Type II secretion system protein E n=1 Tax=Methylobacillus flagellatus (strain ATCC 51484 / DSM 6875 / VKM B-1610 / KT) TaxID=265072 RepID=Q1GYK3_METFK|nr:MULTISPECIES: GspE/PulE family protein [Methylobacillus]ABE50684.1 type II secretion system protein E [Methylobacillus flagellatus KT]MPS47714.1 type II/IV secretion system protein [Methylobacillus sp.]
MNAAAEIFSPERMAEAQSMAMRNNRSMVDMLQSLSALEDQAYAAALAEATQLQLFSMDALHAMQPAFEVMSFAMASRLQCLPLRENGMLWLVLADPFDQAVLDWAAEWIAEDFHTGLAHFRDIQAYLSRHEEDLRAMDGDLLETGEAMEADKTNVEHLSLQSIHADSSPVIRMVNSTLYDALKAGASDIHMESVAAGLMVKYRIDGVLVHVGSMQGADMAEQAVSRVKILAELDIAERRVPQDGRFKVMMQGRDVDFRVSIMPSIYGEDAVLRVLDRKSLSDQAKGLSLKQLGFDDYIIEDFRRLVREPYGMVLVTGPTGSGKTTSLYAAISEVNHGQDKIITIEDPVEYQLPGVLQIPVNEKKGLTFARGLRSILRHDPDKIMVGEIRDPETAQIAVQSALTGHLVFTTLHANNVFDVISRFLHMNVEAYSLVAALNGVMAQRLVRLVCPQCAEPAEASDELLLQSKLTRDQVAGYHLRQGKGCGHCRGSGYRGRKAVAELLALDDELREMIIAREPLRKLKEAGRARGMKSLREAALEAVARGETTLEEINRVTFVA